MCQIFTVSYRARYGLDDRFPRFFHTFPDAESEVISCQSKNLILLTSAIKVAPGADALHTNRDMRLAETKHALLAIMRQRLYNQLVICDGSNNAIFTQSEIRYLSDQYHVELEQLVFQQDVESVARFTKGLGEIEILEYALRNSRLIKADTLVIKVSGRWVVRNLLDIHRATSERKSFFYTFYPRTVMFRPYVHTAFYKAQVSLLRQILTAAKFDLRKGRRPLEAAFYSALKNWDKEWISVPYPDYDAFSGTRAAPHKTSMVLRAGYLIGSRLSQYCFSLRI